MDVKYQKAYPYYYGCFIVLALFPQMFGFNGTVIDDIFKIGLIALLLYKTSALRVIRSVGVFTAAFLFISVVDTLGVVVVNEASILRESMEFIISSLLVIVLVEPALKARNIGRESILLFYKIYTYFMAVASTYNMIVHYSSLIHITSLSVYTADGICSFFDNKNTFGVFLLFGVLSATILRAVTGQIRWSFWSVVFLVNELMAMCRTAIVLSIILISILFFIDYRSKKNMLAFLSVFLIVLNLIFNDKKINKFVFETLFSSTDSIISRNKYIENLLPFSKGLHFWFGYGNDGAMELAKQYMGNAYYHNGYLKVLMSGGIIKLCLEIMAILFSIYYGEKCRKIDRQVGKLCIISSLTYATYIFVESVVLFDKPVVAIMAAMFIISMPIMFYNCLLNEENILEK